MAEELEGRVENLPGHSPWREEVEQTVKGCCMVCSEAQSEDKGFEGPHCREMLEAGRKIGGVSPGGDWLTEALIKKRDGIQDPIEGEGQSVRPDYLSWNWDSVWRDPGMSG